jgi:DNA-binding NarL/FixJ family response regulator
MNDVRFAIVSADVLMRELVSRVLPQIEARLACVAQLASDAAATAGCRAAGADLVVFDLGSRGRGDLVQLRELAASAWPLLVIVPGTTDAMLGEMLPRRGYGLLSRQSTADELAGAAMLVARGGIYIDAALGELLTRRNEPPGPTHLSQRERHVLQLVAEGYSTKEVATILRLSIKTVDKYRTTLMQKLDVHDVVKLTHCAIRLGYVTVAG